MLTRSPIIERYAAPHSWVTVGLGVASLAVGIWQGEKSRKDQKKAQKQVSQNIDVAYTLQQKQARINDLRAQNEQLALVAAQSRQAMSEKSGALGQDKVLLYAAIGIGAIVLLKSK